MLHGTGLFKSTCILVVLCCPKRINYMYVLFVPGVPLDERKSVLEIKYKYLFI
jgi:hypothetical protein